LQADPKSLEADLARRTTSHAFGAFLAAAWLQSAALAADPSADVAAAAPSDTLPETQIQPASTPLEGASIHTNDAALPPVAEPISAPLPSPTLSPTLSPTVAPVALPAESAPILTSATAIPAVAPGSAPDLLDRIRAGMSLPQEDRSAIDIQLSWYARNPEYLERVFSRAELYLYHIIAEVEARGMPLELALLPVVESAFEPFAYSRSHAAGLWQFIPGTGKRFGLPQDWWYDGRRDVLESTRAALDYLQYIHDQNNGDWLLAVAGYNCGENCVARAVAENRARGLPTDFFSLRLPSETRAYVPKLLAMSRLVANPEVYGIGFSEIPNEPYFTRVETNGQIDLSLAAQLAGITRDELTELNPAFHRWATPPQGPHHLLLPLTAADSFRQGLSQLTPDEMMRVSRHKVTRGETVDAVAKKYSTTAYVLRHLNDLPSSSRLVVGSDIRVPSGSTSLPEKVARAAARVDGGRGRVASRAGGRRPSIHVVRRGESLWKISRRTGVDMKTLARLNGLNPNETLRPGKRLVLAQGAKASPSRRASNSAAGGTVRYRVRSGDTLFKIAQIYNVTVAQIRSWNNLAAAAKLQAGQTLTIKLPQRR
jgi:membrane-bound lytic murein transglycosylase D